MQNQKIQTGYSYALWGVGLVVLSIRVLHQQAYYRLEAALNYWVAPIRYVLGEYLPQNFARDFSGGIAVYNHSLVMPAYKLAYELGIGPETFTRLFMITEWIMIFFGAIWLSRALFPRNQSFSHILFAFVMVCGTARHSEFSRFKDPVVQGVFYNYADFALFLGIISLVSRRIRLGYSLIGLSFAIHPIRGLIGLCAAYVLQRGSIRSLTQWKTLRTLWPFALISVAWVLFAFSNQQITHGVINASQWFEFTQFRNYHWYPIAFGVFDRFHTTHVIPQLALTLVFFAAFLQKKPISPFANGFIRVFWILSLLVGLGVLQSTLLLSPSLTKLCLHRADGLLTVFFLLGLVHLAHRCLARKQIIATSLLFALLVSPLQDHSPDFPLLYAIAALLTQLPYLGKNQRRVALSLAIASILIFTAYYFSGQVVHKSQWAAYVGNKNTLWYSIVAASILISCRIWRKTEAWLPIPLVTTLAVLAVVTTVTPRRSPAYWQKAHDYLQSQHWAKNNTAVDSLFMTNPSLATGWRNFSERSEFGTADDWLTFWTYDSNANLFNLGMKRFGTFGIHPREFIEGKPDIQDSNRMRKALKQRYYALSDQEIDRISKENGIDYWVFERQLLERPPTFDVAYQNPSYLIVKTPRETNSPMVP